MKVCHITYSFPALEVGGMQTHNSSLIKYLIKKGYDVDVIVIRDPSKYSKKIVTRADKTVNKGIKIHNIWYNGFPSWIFKVRKKIKEIEKNGKIDIFDIHCINDIINFLFKKRKIILSIHFFELNCPGGPSNMGYPQTCIANFKKCKVCCGIKVYLKWKFLRWLTLKKISKIMVKYEYMKTMAIKSGIDENKIEVIPHWLNIEKLRSIDIKSKDNLKELCKDNKILIHVGRLTPEKHVLCLLKAFKLLAKKIKNIKLVLVGDGILRADLEDFCKLNNIDDQVIFVGDVDHNEVFRYLSLSDCAISCQLFDNYGWALIEYMCAQKPIIATNVGATLEILKDGYNALIAEPTPLSLSLNIQKILENPQLGNKLAKNAFITVSNKHGLKNLKRYEELIHRSIK